MLTCRALLFDMDGLMVDSEPLWFDVQRSFAHERGGHFTADMARACVGRGLAHTLGIMERAFGFTVDVKRDAADIVDRFIARVGELTLKPGFLDLLEEARDLGVPRALASSSARRLVEATLSRFELLARFDAIVTGDCVAHPKPAPDIFLEASRRLGASPQDCVVLEDSQSGVRAALAAGMSVIAVPESEPSAFEAWLATAAPSAGSSAAIATDLRAARRLIHFDKPC